MKQATSLKTLALVTLTAAAITFLMQACGVWTEDATNAYTAKFHFLRFNADGTVAGSQNVVRTIGLAADGKSLTSTIAAQVLDPTGTVVQAICGSEVGKRLY